MATKCFFKVGMKVTKLKVTFFIFNVAKQFYLESNQTFFLIGVEDNQKSRKEKTGLGEKVYKCHLFCMKASGYWHCDEKKASLNYQHFQKMLY